MRGRLLCSVKCSRKIGCPAASAPCLPPDEKLARWVFAGDAVRAVRSIRKHRCDILPQPRLFASAQGLLLLYCLPTADQVHENHHNRHYD